MNITMEFVKAYDQNKTKPPLRTIEDDYKTCKTNLKDAFIKVGGVDGLVVDENYAITFKKPKSYQVYNPFYNIYIVHKISGFKEFLKTDDTSLCNEFNLASISQNALSYGNFLEFKNGKGRVDFNLLKNSFVINPCCEILGISINKREFLPNSHLNTLVKRVNPYDGYIGADFYQKGQKVYVLNVDFNLKNIHFCPNDQIVSVDGVKITSKAQLNRMILSTEYKDDLKIVIKRSNSYKTLNVKSLHKPKYNINAVTYLQKLGIKFDKNLIIRKVYKNSFASKKGLKKGDRLIQINFKDVKDVLEAKDRFLYGKKEKFHFLFSRDDFQFFINFKRKDIKGGLVAFEHCSAI